MAERNKQEAKALALARSYAGTDATRLAGDPIAALEWVISESHGLTARLAGIVRALTDEELRYTGKLGEQTRGELTALLRAMKDLSAMSERAIGLGIAERRLAIDRRQVELVVEALTAALNAAGLDLDGQHKAQQVLSRHLRAVEGGKSGG